jgi:hypothetical protein
MLAYAWDIVEGHIRTLSSLILDKLPIVDMIGVLSCGSTCQRHRLVSQGVVSLRLRDSALPVSLNEVSILL